MYATHAANEAAHAYAIGKSPGQVQQEVTSRLPNSYAARTKVTRSGADRVTVTLPVLSACRYEYLRKRRNRLGEVMSTTTTATTLRPDRLASSPKR